MCIRDSSYVDYTSNEFSSIATADEATDTAEKAVTNAVSVSYTHLDVYKRQFHSLLLIRMKGCQLRRQAVPSVNLHNPQTLTCSKSQYDY